MVRWSAVVAREVCSLFGSNPQWTAPKPIAQSRLSCTQSQAPKGGLVTVSLLSKFSDSLWPFLQHLFSRVDQLGIWCCVEYKCPLFSILLTLAIPNLQDFSMRTGEIEHLVAFEKPMTVPTTGTENGGGKRKTSKRWIPYRLRQARLCIPL